jgi:hypothetical protein
MGGAVVTHGRPGSPDLHRFKNFFVASDGV